MARHTLILPTIGIWVGGIAAPYFTAGYSAWRVVRDGNGRLVRTEVFRHNSQVQSKRLRDAGLLAAYAPVSNHPRVWANNMATVQ